MKQRPLAWIGMWILFALAAAVFCPASVCRYLTAGFLVGGVICLLVPVLRRTVVWPVLWLLLAISFFYVSFPRLAMEDVRETWQDQDAILTAVVNGDPEKSSSGRFVYTLTPQKLMILTDDEEEEIHYEYPIRLSVGRALPVQAGDTLTGKVHLYAPEGTGISSRSYYESRGMPLLCWLYEYEDVTVEEGEGEVSLIVRIKNQISDSLHTVLPDIPAKICAAIALGEKESLPQAVETDFRRAGASALLVVSGMHLSIVVQCLSLLLRRTNRWVRCLCCAAGIFLFACLTGFGFSVQRSAIMQLLFIVGQACMRKSDGLNSLGAAALIICLINPLAAGDAGLLLSFSATAGILLLQPRVYAWWQAKKQAHAWFLQHPRMTGLLQIVINAAGVSLSASLFTLPVLLLVFGEFSLWAVASNFVLQIPCMVVLIGTLLGGVCTVLGVSGAFCYLLAGKAAVFMSNAASWFASLPLAGVVVEPATACLWGGGVCLLAAVGCLVRWKKPMPLVAAGCSACLLVGLLIIRLWNRAAFPMITIQVTGEQMAVLAAYQGRGEVIYSTGFSDGELLSLQEQTQALWSFPQSSVRWRTEEAISLDLQGLTMLICLSGCSADEIPESYRQPDILLLVEVPEKAGLLQSTLTVVSTKTEKTVPGQWLLELDYEQTLSFYQNAQGEWKLEGSGR